MKKKLTACILVLAVAISFMPVSAFAGSSTAKMTAYDQVLKYGSNVYCAGAGAIYKVKVKNGKVVKVKRLVKGEAPFGAYTYFQAMKKYGGNIYYRMGSEGTMGTLWRVNYRTGKVKQLATTGYGADYAIKNKRIYYYKIHYTDYDEKMVKRSMKLNGKNKKKTSTKPVLKVKKSNASGYSIKIKEKNGYCRDYLKTPKGTFYLGKIKLW